MSVVILADNGETLLGADAEGNLFDGQRIGVGWDEFVVETTVTDSGFDRTTTCVCGELIGKDSRDKTTFLTDAASRLPDASAEDLDALWQTELANIPHSKVYVDAVVDGALVSVEKKRPCIQWTPKAAI